MASSPQSQYSLTRAQQSYKSLVQIHEKNGEAGARLEIRTFAKPEVSIRLNSKNPFWCLSLFHLLARHLSLCPGNSVSWRGACATLLQ